MTLLIHGLAQKKTENVVIVTLDGFRWQEVFTGADDSLIGNKDYTNDTTEVKKKYGAATAEEKRRKLLPFFWSTIAHQGQLHGNRSYGSKVDVKNRYWFSYPGYNEIFTGYPDTAINSNDKNNNKNVTVLEYLNQQPALKGKIAAFTSWDVFDAIFNEQRAGFIVSAGFDSVPICSPRFDLLNEMQIHSYQPFDEGVRPDMLTYYIAKEYLKTQKPKVLYIGFDETDDYAHAGNYQKYLNAAHLIDEWLTDLWNTLQSMPEYRGKTTLIITTDHGRGDLVKKEWTSHGAEISGASEIWMAFLGSGIPPGGEIKKAEQLYQAQIAPTIAQLLGFQYTPKHPVERGITDIIGKEISR
ncbi:MAG: alkaline phosphatase family protein [Flavisolibacter sp.]|nr:alkaline phosphatase family protein [Flavisolibacter sp.]